ncbi:sulfotransferase [Pseudooceanicola sp.]|uniref:tetratricopeptide repeat-containing sulfotransferase family protein n=1 Tax=Pseudooceanicola sp. TaxID=1914328 RepID=UPI0035C6A863
MHSQATLNRLQLLSNRAEEEQNKGNFSIARRFANEMFSIDPNNVAAYLNYVNAGRMSADDPITQRLLAIGSGEALAQPARAMVLFLQGKTLDDIGDYDNAFRKFIEANRVFGATADLKSWKKRVLAITRKPPARRTPLPAIPPRMVFVLGMPRSGTSLTAQMLSAHSQIESVGEQTGLNLSVNAPRGIPNPDTVRAFAKADLDAMRQNYLKSLPPDNLAAGKAGKILIDKMPGNYWSAFAIPILFPDALIIHTERDRLATCWSCFRNQFARGHDYAYNFDNILAQYALKTRMCETWKTYTAPGQWIDLQFESFVQDPKAFLQPVLTRLGLDWEDACLSPASAATSFNTLSRWQIRQDVSPEIADAWRVYEPMIRRQWKV